MKQSPHIPDEEYKRDVEKAYEIYMACLKEADEFMSKTSLEEFINRAISRQDPIPETHAYEELAREERAGMLRAAVARLAMRRMRKVISVSIRWEIAETLRTSTFTVRLGRSAASPPVRADVRRTKCSRFADQTGEFR